MDMPNDYADNLLKLKRKKLRRGINFKITLFLMIFSAGLSFLLFPYISFPRKSWIEREQAPYNFRSPKSFEIVNEEATSRLKDAAESSVKSVYDYDPKLYSQNIRKLFKALERARENPSKSVFEEALGGIKIDPLIFSYLKEAKFDWRLAWQVKGFLDGLKNNYIIADKVILETDIDRGIIIRNIDSKKEVYFDDFGKILDISEAKKIILDHESVHFLRKLAAALAFPNVSFNKEETEQRKNIALAQINPVVIKVKKNEMIIRKGESIQKHHLIVLRGIQKELSRQKPGLVIFFTALFFFFLFQILGHFFLSSFPQFKLSLKDVIVMGVLLLLSLLLARMYVFATGAIVERFLWLPSSIFIYLLPIATGSLIVHFLMGLEASLIFSLISSLCLGLFLEKNFFYTIYFLVASLIGIQSVKICRSITDIYKAGLRIGLANMVVLASVIILSFLESNQSIRMLWNDLSFGMGAAFLNGILCSFFVVTLTPLCEYVFHYTTDLKLLELSNLNHPLLREFMIRSPGSYHHGLMVGTLAESGAEAIGANALLARVGGYYHDIGKMKNPHYYIENQFRGVNIHDRQPAHLSKTMIMSHVREGVKVGNEYRLGKPITDIIEQHLGTSLMVYFYHKAQKEYATRSKHDELLPPVNENDFRYPGPKPKTKEAAIVMLADAVEASTRAFNSSNLSRLRMVCERVVHRVFVDGQLDDSELTLKDLQAIVDGFYHVLVGVYHRRISYPGEGIQEDHFYDPYNNPKSTKESAASDETDSNMGKNALFKKMGS